jgi:phosphoenolpyruvate carboxylase
MSQASAKSVVRSDIFFAEKDKALREDVRRLGQLVGQLVEEQGGEALFDLVEAARRAAIAQREGDEHAGDRLQELIAELAPQTAADFIRAFSTYFQMVNTAERVHRIRRRRSYLRDSSKPQPYGVLDVVQRLNAKGVARDDILKAFDRVELIPVFTSHATDVTRRTLLRKQHNIAKLLVQMLDPYLTPQETESILGQIRLDMTTGWQTEDHTERPGLSDEGEHVLFFLTDVLYRIIPSFYEGIDAALAQVFAEDARRMHVPVLVRFGSWIGGDMDGHPDVTGRVIRETLARHRILALNLYHNECHELARHLSQTESRVAVSKELHERIEFYSAHFPKAAHTVPSRHRRMPYRVFLRLVAARLSSTHDDAAFPYESPDELSADIDLIGASLRANRGQHAGLFALNRLLRRVETFGFHMATLDIRQHAKVHARVVAEGLGEAKWDQFTSARQTVRIKDALSRRESPLNSVSSEARRMMGVFQSIAHCRRKYGDRAVGLYIVSGATGPEDVLSVLLLARWAHLGPKNQDVPLDIAPLFQNIEDLENSVEIMSRLLADERYRSHLRGRGDRQTVMIECADGHLDAGVVAACWTMHKAQRVLREAAREFGVALTVFHGRGGTISRAGRRVNDAIMSSSATSAEPQKSPLRMTETGEQISAKFGLRGIAVRTLEQTIGSLLEAAASPPVPDPREAAWSEMMQTVADHSRAAFRELVDFSGAFAAYFRLATPIDAIEKLNMVVERERNDQDDDPAAQPGARRWEYAWVQTRCLLPAWYGFGRGIEQALDQYGAEAVSQMFADWPFGRVLLADIEQSLAKADIDIARRYSELAGELHERFFPVIQAEYDRSVACLLQLTGQTELLEAAPTLRRAIRLRNPYVDPMSFLQVDLLRRWRESKSANDAVLKALRASINGIAHGLQNAG